MKRRDRDRLKRYPDNVPMVYDGEPITIDGKILTLAVARAMLRNPLCTVCHGEADGGVGIFVPNDQFAVRFTANTIEAGMSAPVADKRRTLLYGICSTCAALPDSVERVERSFGAIMTRGRR